MTDHLGGAAAHRMQSAVAAAAARLMEATNPQSNRALADMAIRATQFQVPQTSVAAAAARLMEATSPQSNRALADTAIQATQFQVPQTSVAAAAARLMEATSPQSNRALADTAIRATEAVRLSVTMPRLDLAGLDAGYVSGAAAHALRPLDMNGLARFIEETTGAAEPSSVSVGVLERLQACRLSPAMERRVLVSLVFLIIFLSLAAVAADNLDEAKIVTAITGTGAFPIAEKAASATNKALRRREERSE